MKYYKYIRALIINVVIKLYALFYKLKLKYQFVALQKYETSILKHEIYQKLTGSKNYSIFVYFEPDGNFSKSADNILSALHQAGVNILLVCNHELTNKQVKEISKYVHMAITRKNIGFDFGAYKDCVNFMISRRMVINKLIFLNDSVYYFNQNIAHFVEKLLENYNVISAFENWEAPHKYHLQSFAISIDKSIFESQIFQQYWLKYRPVSDRLYCIEKGEKIFSEVLLKLAERVEIIYPFRRLYGEPENLNMLKDSTFKVVLPKVFHNTNTEKLFLQDLEVRSEFENEDRTFFYDNKSLRKQLDIIKLLETGPFSPIHSGAYFFSAIGCPIVKKDLVFRNVFELWQLDIFLREFYCADEITEYLTLLRKRGKSQNLSVLKKLRVAIGAL